MERLVFIKRLRMKVSVKLPYDFFYFMLIFKAVKTTSKSIYSQVLKECFRFLETRMPIHERIHCLAYISAKFQVIRYSDERTSFVILTIQR